MCGDEKSIGLLLGMQLGNAKSVFLFCEWESRSKVVSVL
jgi:hypothetical protein